MDGYESEDAKAAAAVVRNEVWDEGYRDPQNGYRQGWALGSMIEHKFNGWLKGAQDKIEAIAKQVEEL